VSFVKEGKEKIYNNNKSVIIKQKVKPYVKQSDIL
jgi:hypothetical protein